MKRLVNLSVVNVRGLVRNALLVVVSAGLIVSLLPLLKTIKRNQQSGAVAPQIERIVPTVGSVAGGNKIMIYGRNFHSFTDFNFRQIFFGNRAVVQYGTGCGITTDNKTYCWGSNQKGQLGIGSDSLISKYPVQVAQGDLPTSESFQQLARRYDHTCALASNNKAYCWGKNDSGQLGNNSTSQSNVPSQVAQGQLPVSAHFTQIAVAADHTCALASNNKAYCWGKNDSGQLGNNSTSQSNVPSQVAQGQLPVSAHFTRIVTRNDHTCALASNNKAYCWGKNNSGQLGNNSTSQSNVPSQVAQGQLPVSAHFTQIAPSKDSTCALASNNKAYCWGRNHKGQLGNGATNDAITPTEVLSGELPASAHFTQISAGGDKDIIDGGSHACALASDNKVYCWGSNNVGQLGNGVAYTNNPQTTPVQVHQGQLPSTAHFTQIVVSDYATDLVASDGETYFFGGLFTGSAVTTPELADLRIPSTKALVNGSPVPTRFIDQNRLEITIPSTYSPKKVNVEVRNADETEAVMAKAYEYYRESSPALYTMTPNRGPIEGGQQTDAFGDNLQYDKWQLSAAGKQHGCAVDYLGKIYCYGKNTSGQLGTGSLLDAKTPVAVVSSGLLQDQTIVSLAAGNEHTCALTSTDRILCWGGNDKGQLGNGTTVNSMIPVAVDTSGALNGKGIMSLAAGGNTTCVVDIEGKAYCWGGNDKGQLGNGTTVNSMIPVAVDTSGVLNGRKISQLAVGDMYTCAIAEGKAYCWGINNKGQLGNNTTSNSSTPVQVVQGQLPGSAKFTKIAAGGHSCAVASDNHAYCWGDNMHGQLGNGTRVQSSVPMRVSQGALPSAASLREISVGLLHSCAIASDHKVYCWGSGVYGQLGHAPNGGGGQETTPVAVNANGVLKNRKITRLVIAQNYSCAFSDDNNLFCWGSNESQQLGFVSKRFDRENTPTIAPKASYKVVFGTTSGDSLDYLNNLYPDDTNLGRLALITPPAALANNTTPAPHSGSVRVQLIRLLDNKATNKTTYYYGRVPTAPRNLQATVAGVNPTVVNLTWQSPAQSGNSSVRKYQLDSCLVDLVDTNNCDNENGWNELNSGPGLQFQQTSGFVSDRQYKYRVRAANDYGWGAYSEITAVTVPSYFTLSINQGANIQLQTIHPDTYSSAKLDLAIAASVNTGYQLTMTGVAGNSLERDGGGGSLASVGYDFANPGVLTSNSWGFYIPNTQINQQHNEVSLGQFVNQATVQTNQPNNTVGHAAIPTSPLVIAKHSKNADGKQLELIFGIKVSSGQPHGSYRRVIRFEAVGQ